MYRFIINPMARSGKGKEIWKKLEDELLRRHIEFEPYYTEKSGDTGRLAGRIQEEHPGDPIISIGGDGSLGDMLNGVDLAKEPTLGLIPAGSGNDFNRGMGYTNDAMASLERIITCKECRTLDAGEAEFDYRDETGEVKHAKKRFVVSAGIGYDADTCLHLNRSKTKAVFNKLGIGKLGYFAIGFAVFFIFKRTRGTLCFDGGTPVKTRQIGFISAHSLPYEGGGYPFARLASNTDGELMACVAAPKTRFRFFWAFILSKTFRDFHTKFDGIYNKDFKEMHIDLESAVPLHTDGEDFNNANNITFRVLPRAFKYIG